MKKPQNENDLKTENNHKKDVYLKNEVNQKYEDEIKTDDYLKY